MIRTLAILAVPTCIAGFVLGQIGQAVEAPVAFMIASIAIGFGWGILVANKGW